MRNLSLSLKDIYNGNLLLVNKDYPINEKYYKAKSLVPIDIEYKDILLEFKTATVLAHLIDDINSKGSIIPVSGYRTREEQKKIYSDSLRENGEEFTKKYLALPGHSEHELGLAIDLGEKQDKIDFLRPDFPYEGICQDFRLKAAKYGFIERYEKDKEEITAMGHEPWHFRYVGYPHSKIMSKKNLCLEEYIDFLKTYPYKKGGFRLIVDNHRVDIYYIPLLSTEEKVIQIPKDGIYQISGNNVDGCIVTLWK